MATTADFMAYVHEQSALGPALSYRKMFGEYALYLHGKVVALVCDNSLYVKPTEASAHLTDTLGTHPPYPGAKPHLLADALLDEPEQLAALLEATAAVLPPPKPKRPKGKASR